MIERDFFAELLGGPSVVVHERRSVLLYLDERWQVDRADYWKRLFVAMARPAPSLSRVTVAESVVQLAREPGDLSQLVDGVAAREPGASAACKTLFETAGALPKMLTLSPWVQACEAFADIGDAFTLRLAARLLLRMIDLRKDRDAQDSLHMARAARVMLNSSWKRTPTESFAAMYAVHAVVETLDAAREQGVGMLETVFDSTSPHAAREEMRAWLLSRADRLMTAPEFVGRMYITTVRVLAEEEATHDRELSSWLEKAYEAEKAGRTQTPVPSRRASSLLPEVDASLEKHAKEFLQRAPNVAARVLAECVERWNSRGDAVIDMPTDVVSLEVQGRSFKVVGRHVDASRYPSGDIGEVLQRELISALVRASDEDASLILDGIVSRPAPASLWTAILDGALDSERLLAIATELLFQAHALRLFARPIRRLLIRWRGKLPERVRARLVDALASLDEGSPDRTTIESALAKGSTSDVGSAAQDPNEASSAVGHDETAFGIDDDGDLFDLSQLGLRREDLNEPANSKLRAAYRAADHQYQRVRELSQARIVGGVPLVEPYERLAELKETLSNPDAHPSLITRGWCSLAELASAIAAVDDSADATLLVEASLRLDSLPWGRGHSFTDLLNLSQAFPRAEAVSGLLRLLSRDTGDRVLPVVERLSRDEEPAVRFQVAHEMRFLVGSNERGWAIAERLIHDDVDAVAAAAVHQLGPFFAADAARAIALSDFSLRRFTGADEAARLGKKDALFQLAWYHLSRAEEMATSSIAYAISKIVEDTTGFSELMHSYRGWLTIGHPENDDAEGVARTRTLALFHRIARACISALHSRSQDKDPNARFRSDRSPHSVLLENVAMQLYFASGAFKGSDDDPVPSEVVARLYFETRDLMLEIGTAGSIDAADRVLDTLEHVIFDESGLVPSREVLSRFVAIAQSAIAHGWGRDFWRLDAMERVVRRSVAERTESLFDATMLASWSAIIDPLVELGWYQAYLLARDFDLSR